MRTILHILLKIGINNHALLYLHINNYTLLYTHKLHVIITIKGILGNTQNILL